MNIKQSPAGYVNVKGPLVQDIQRALNQAGENAGTVDGLWGGTTLNALKEWQKKNGMAQPNGIVDDAAWQKLTGTPVPPILDRVLQVTAAWEGTGYGGSNGNFDGQGITWGLLGFTWKNGELQDILKEVRTNFPQVYQQAFGGLAAKMDAVLAQDRDDQMDFARSISTSGGNSLKSDWSAAFRRLGDAPEVQAIENRIAEERYWKAAQRLITEFDIESDAGKALCFDIVVQITVTDAIRADIHRLGDGKPELERMRVMAQTVANHANLTYYKDVLSRKMSFVDGRGVVHGDKYDLSCWGIV